MMVCSFGGWGDAKFFQVLEHWCKVAPLIFRAIWSSDIEEEEKWRGWGPFIPVFKHLKNLAFCLPLWECHCCRRCPYCQLASGLVQGAPLKTLKALHSLGLYDFKTEPLHRCHSINQCPVLCTINQEVRTTSVCSKAFPGLVLKS